MLCTATFPCVRVPYLHMISSLALSFIAPADGHPTGKDTPHATLANKEKPAGKL